MACKQMKQIIITIYDQNYLRKDWYFDFDSRLFHDFLNDLMKGMKRLGIGITVSRNRDTAVSINSYADLLNVVKISSSQEGHGNLCVGHVIGKSERLDVMEDIGIAVRRVAFAPETVAPSSEFRKVCHNCGCGC